MILRQEGSSAHSEKLWARLVVSIDTLLPSRTGRNTQGPCECHPQSQFPNASTPNHETVLSTCRRYSGGHHRTLPLCAALDRHSKLPVNPYEMRIDAPNSGTRARTRQKLDLLVFKEVNWVRFVISSLAFPERTALRSGRCILDPQACKSGIACLLSKWLLRVLDLRARTGREGHV
jgi:hypothetical protein